MHRDLDAPVRLPPLVYLADGDEVTIGRPDTDSYGIFPPDGAAVVRRLAAGATPRQVAEWYEAEFGESLDVDHLLAALAELELLHPDGEAPVETPPPVRWQRLGRALFSWPAWLLYAGLILWAAVSMVRSPELAPSYRHLFFTDYYTLIEIGLFVGNVPLLMLHEAYHALAGRRLGVRSRLRISHRLYFLTLETSLDGLVAVPRRKRLLPILAGMLIDVVAFAVLTLAADLTRRPDGEFSFIGGWCLAVAFTLLLRIVWQFFFYLRTDLYTLIATLLGCVDLHTTAKRLLAYRFGQLVGRPSGHDPSQWHPADRRAARWYAWLILVGYTLSIGTFLLALAPALYQIFAGVLGRIAGSGTGWDGWLDSVLFLAITAAQIVTSGWLVVRERRQLRHSRLQHVIG
jgi:hypothetical protein